MENTEIENEISKLCSQFQQMNNPGVLQIMTELEKLDSVFSNSDTPLHIHCRWITAFANLQCLKPENSLGAEVQVNSLLQFMASSSCVARALACSLLRIFCVALNPLGQHITTQGFIHLSIEIQGHPTLRMAHTYLCIVIQFYRV